MVGFVRKDLVNSCPRCDSNSQPFDYKSEAITITTIARRIRLDGIHVKVLYNVFKSCRVFDCVLHLKTIIQWWFVNPGFDSPEISLIRTKSAEIDFRFWTDGRFSNPENSLIRKYRPGTSLSGLTNHHCTCTSASFWFCPIYTLPWHSPAMKHKKTVANICQCKTLVT